MSLPSVRLFSKIFKLSIALSLGQGLNWKDKKAHLFAVNAFGIDSEKVGEALIIFLIPRTGASEKYRLYGQALPSHVYPNYSLAV